MSSNEKSGSMDLGLVDNYGGFFQPLENDKPYIKASFEGFPGSGKTFTMVNLAIWLWQRIGSKKPIVYVDSEKAGKFLKHLFAAAGVPVLHKPTRSMGDLETTMRLMREQSISDILLVDSITHFWENFLESYKAKKKKNQGRLDFGDWGILKPVWRECFSDPFVRDGYHAMFTGRAAFEYSDVIDENGKRESFKSGVKMRAEGETAYEPDLLVMMERNEDLLEGDKREVYRSATVLKDRSTIIDGKTFRNPTPSNFAPCIEACLVAPTTLTTPIEGDSQRLFHDEEQRRDWAKERDIVLETIESELVEQWPGQGGDDKQAKIKALKVGFGTASWTWLKNQRVDVLKDGLARIKEHIAACNQQAAEELAAQGPQGDGATEPVKNGAKPKKARGRSAAA